MLIAYNFRRFLFIFIAFVGSLAGPNLARQRKLCSNRCHRILKRSLERIDQAATVEEILYRTVDYRRQRLLASLEESATDTSANFEQLPEHLQNICWKFFDFEDCSRQCEKAFFRRRKRKNNQKTAPEEEKETPIGPQHRKVLRFCHQNNLSVPHAYFSCIHKFHAFVEIRCSSYQQKAVQLRLIALQIRHRQMSVDKFDDSDRDEDGTTPNADASDADASPQHGPLSNSIDQEVCLLLHHHSTCLGNALGRHCPFARSLFTNRHALRDNFLSFVLPFGTAVERTKRGRNSNGAEKSDGTTNSDKASIELDQLFPEEMLDMCQLLDFNRMMAQWQEQQIDGVSTNPPHNSEQDELQIGSEIRRWTTKRAVDTMPTDEAGINKTPEGSEVGRRRLFSSDEDLLDTPPNFQYSSARLSPDFYTRYAIWWGGRSRGQSAAALSTRVQLLPSDTTQKVTATDPNDQLDGDHLYKWPNTKTKASDETPPEAAATSATWPDAMPPTTHWPNGQETVLVDGPAQLYHSVSLPYLINGHVTVPHKQWTTEQLTTAVTRRTEIRLLSDNDGQPKLSPARANSRSGGTLQTHNTQMSDEFKIHKLPNDDERDGDRMSTTNWPWNDSEESERLLHLRTDANNVYFAKILQFDDDEDTKRRAGDGTTPQGARVTAYIEHIPRDGQQTKPMQTAADHRHFGQEAEEFLLDDSSASADDDYFGDEDDNDDQRNASGESEYDFGRHKTSPPRMPGSTRPPAATPSTTEASRRGLADLSPKTRAPFGGAVRRPPSSNGGQSSRSRIVVTAEPVPGAHSDVLLVLLGLYGTFFGVATFLLLCLLLACLERRRRRLGTALMGRYRRKYWPRQKGGGTTNAKKGGSAILYLDERLGTVKGATK